jgi:hypothetical protein
MTNPYLELMRDEFLSEEDLDLRNLDEDELIAYWNLWLEQAQATNDLDEALYSHGVFERDPTIKPERLEVPTPHRWPASLYGKLPDAEEPARRRPRDNEEPDR